MSLEHLYATGVEKLQLDEKIKIVHRFCLDDESFCGKFIDFYIYSENDKYCQICESKLDQIKKRSARSSKIRRPQSKKGVRRNSRR